MKKNNSTLVMIALIFATLIGWYSVLNNRAEMQQKYNDYIIKAQKFEEKEIYIDALENYRFALELNSGDFDLTVKISDMYYKLGDKDGFIDMSEAAIKIDPYNAEPYIKEANYYTDISDYHNALEVVERAKKWIDDNEELNILMEILSVKVVNKYISFEKCMDWHIQGEENYVPSYSGDKWGLIDSNGRKVILSDFDYLGAYNSESGVLPACKEGVWYYVDLNGYKKLIGDEKYQFLGSFGNGLAPAQRNNLYGYIDKDFKEQRFEFNFAGCFAENVAAVQKNKKWALISKDLKEITGYDYDDIKLDDYGFCSMYGLVSAKKGNTWQLLGLDGKSISDELFDDIKLPAAKDEPIAVKLNGKWGFVDIKGKIIIQPTYRDAGSFSLGLAPVQVNDNWGYINLENELKIESVYAHAKPFSADGRAVIHDGYFCDFIVLCKYDE